MSTEIEKNEVIGEADDKTKFLLTKKEDYKKAIMHFYSEIKRLKKGEERKYQFPITLETCMESINQCYDYIYTLEELRRLYPENMDEYEIDLETANVSLCQIEDYSHTFESNKPVEILTGEQAIPVTSQAPQETKGSKRRKSVVKETVGNSSPKVEPFTDGKNEDEGTVNSVVNSLDVSKEELYQIQDIVKDKEDPIIPADVIISEETPVTKQEASIEVKESDNSLAIEQPKEEDEVILKVVVESNEKEEVPVIEPPKTDNVPMLTNEDIIADSQEENINDIELIVSEENNEDDNDDNESIEELPEEYAEYGVKAISRNKAYSFKTKLQKKTIDEKIVSDIKLFPYDENDENLRKEYFASHNNMISAPHVSRVNLLMSGYFVEISSYGNWDTLSLERTMKNKSLDFVEKEKAILNSIY
jgi:hypothetical protein